MTKPQSNTTKPYIFNSYIPTFYVTALHTVSIILYTPFEQFDTKLVWNLKFNSTLFSWCVFNSDDCIHNMKAESIRVCFDTFYLKVIPTVKFNPKRFFLKEEYMNYLNQEKETYICFELFIIWYYTNTVIKV